MSGGEEGERKTIRVNEVKRRQNTVSSGNIVNSKKAVFTLQAKKLRSGARGREGTQRRARSLLNGFPKQFKWSSRFFTLTSLRHGYSALQMGLLDGLEVDKQAQTAKKSGV